MRLAVWEWRKLFRLPALWVFVGLCLALNGLLLSSPSAMDRAFFHDTSADAAALGQRVDDEFQTGLAALPDTENRELLRQSVVGLENTLEDYDTGELTNFYQSLIEGDSLAQNWMAWKYELLQERVDHLAQTGAALDLYVGPITHDSHQYLYNALFRVLLTESILLSLLCALYLVGYEGLSGTQSLTCVSRTGRRLWKHKTLAALAAALGLYALMALLTLGTYLLLWDYRGIWDSSVSSQFNYFVDMLYSRPFLTWADFTVGSYFSAMIVAGGGLVAVFTLMGLWRACSSGTPTGPPSPRRPSAPCCWACPLRWPTWGCGVPICSQPFPRCACGLPSTAGLPNWGRWGWSPGRRRWVWL